jgi:hypothetical protein
MMMGTTAGKHREIVELAAHAAALRAAIARAELELTAASAEERAIAERIQRLRDSVQDEATTVIVEGAAAPKQAIEGRYEQRGRDETAPAQFLPHDPQKTARTQTTLITRARLRLEERETWRVALAGALLAILLAAIVAAGYRTLRSDTAAPEKAQDHGGTTGTSSRAAPSSTELRPPTPRVAPSPVPISTATTERWPRLRAARPLPSAAATSPPTALRAPIPSAPGAPSSFDFGIPATRDNPASPPAPASKLGTLTILCTPRCDQIRVNGTSVGPGHIFNRPTSVGRKVLVLSAPNGARKVVTVEVEPETTTELRVSMEP